MAFIHHNVLQGNPTLTNHVHLCRKLKLLTPECIGINSNTLYHSSLSTKCILPYQLLICETCAPYDGDAGPLQDSGYRSTHANHHSKDNLGFMGRFHHILQ